MTEKTEHPHRVGYKCDPEKNTACEKKMCFINNGPCNSTAHLKFAKQPVTTVQLVFSITKKEYEEITGKTVEE